MARYLGQLWAVAEKYTAPIVYAGDIFHRWNAPAELINFAIRHLPKGYAVPGQHDLPYHQYDLIERSAYWTLVEAEVLENLAPGQVYNMLGDQDVVLHGFPWGTKVTPRPEYEGALETAYHIAVVHAYVWYGLSKHPQADKTSHVARFSEMGPGYNALVFGDNHVPFMFWNHVTRQTFLNHGTFIRNRADEEKITPGIGILLDDGTWRRMRLDTSEDQWSENKEDGPEPETDPEALKQAKALLEALGEIGDHILSFGETLRIIMGNQKIADEVKRIVVKHLPGG
jgi:hypothetical protein